MMVLFFHAARLALVVFDPFLTSRPLSETLLKSPEGTLITAKPYYQFSSLIFYTNKSPLILNGRYNNLEYGSYAPGSPNVFIDDPAFRTLWFGEQRCYVVAYTTQRQKLEDVLGKDPLHLVAESGGKQLFTNHSIAASVSSPGTP
jgi:hypothetical protein